MIFIDPEIRIRNGIREGAVYYVSVEEIANGDPHYYVILNSSFAQGSHIIMVLATSQIAKKREYIALRELPECTLVVIQKSEYPHFSKETAFNCNEVHVRTMEYLIQKLRNGELKTFQEDIREEILTLLRNGVRASPVVENNIKLLL